MENESPEPVGSLQENEQLKDNLPGSASQEATSDHQESQANKTKKRKKKDFPVKVILTGRTENCQHWFLKKVSDRLSNDQINLKAEMYQGGSGHFLLVFCPVASRVGTDMQNALEYIQGESKAVLVMLHHRPKEYNYFLDTELQARHPAVVLTVHTRYTLEEGLYDCQENKEAVASVVEVLKVHYKKMTKEPSDPVVKRSPQSQLAIQESKRPRSSSPDLASQDAETRRLERQRLKQKPPADRRGLRLEDWEPRKERHWYSCPKKDFPIQVLLTRQMGDCVHAFLQRVSDHLDNINLMTHRYREGSGHFLLVFCPVVSSVDIDMANALEGLHCEPEAVVVMLHLKPKESNSVVDTRKQAQHRAVECTVHARYTLEDGFYFCRMNQEAVAIVAEVLKQRRKMMSSCCCCY